MDDGANIEPTPVAPAAFACFSICTSFLGAAIQNFHTKALHNDNERGFYYLYRWNGYLKAPDPLHFLVFPVVIARVFTIPFSLFFFFSLFLFCRRILENIF